MYRWLIAISMVAVLALGLGFVVGCESNAQTGALVGAGGGALAGQAIGRNTTGTLIGTAVGAGAGYVIGNEGDKKKAQSQSNAAGSQYDNSVTVNIHNANGSISPVKLQRNGARYVGPKGEYYDHLPTESELKQAGYGL
jgi:outer membrane lipoprotein SlyB